MSDNITKKIRRNKKTFYSNERDIIFQQLFNLMNLNVDNTILLNKLYDNVQLKNKLIELIDDIKKFYRCSTWGYFVSINNGDKGDIITLLRSIFKDHDYKIFSKDVITEYNGIKKRYTKLFFSK
jgi:undecaprenyl pyrophosphate synthase